MYANTYTFIIMIVFYSPPPPKGLSGGTTVSATMLCAHKAGIPVFVTGGIGGVHREGEKSKK